MKYYSKNLNRRNFISKTALGTLGASSILVSCSSSNSRKKEIELPELLDKAPQGKTLKAGLIGCGGRGTGAAINFLDAGPDLHITAMGDVFSDKLSQSRQKLKSERNVEISDENCYLGFDSYQKVIDSGVDLVLLCTPPHFRPQHLEAAVNARKHIFMEKPCAVDPIGVRSVLASAEKANAIGLNIVSGTQRRHQKNFLETQRRVANGEIGEITGANIIRNGGSSWFLRRKPEWSEMEYMLRNWVNFSWLSGDHIVEQFIHEIDIMNWHVGEYPLKAIGYGGRQRRVTGNQFDFFSVDYSYENRMRTHCAARQIRGCSNGKEVHISGTKGFADCRGALYDLQGNKIWEYPFPSKKETDSIWKVTNPYVQEHINLVKAIRLGEKLNDAKRMAYSTLVAIMGRIAAYTGKNITWDEVMNSDLYLGPKYYAFGPVPEVDEEVPVPGESRK